MAEIVVVVETSGALQNVAQAGQFEVLHFAEGDNQSELLVEHVQLEQLPTADDLQVRQDDLLHVHMTDQHVAGHLAYGVKEAEV